jgi:hypothetical protein
VWQAFSNHYWPAVYIADAEGRIRYHHYGEGAYDECERVIQELLRDAGAEGIPDDLVAPELEGFEVQADWANLESPETYLGSEQASNYAPGVPADGLELNQWTLIGDWAIERRASVFTRRHEPRKPDDAAASPRRKRRRGESRLMICGP